MSRLVSAAISALLAASPRIADANSCTLYQPQRLGEIRVGCSITVFALPEVDPELPNITRAGETISPTIDHDQVTLEVQMQRYPSPDGCGDLVTSYENRTFDRYVITWSDLQAGDEIEVDGYPMTVPGPGDCGVVDPFFYCQDGVRFCDEDDEDEDEDENEDEGDNERAGCSAGSGSPSWLALLSIAALCGFSRRSRMTSRR